MQSGNRSGTPNYMAPEIIRRRRTDKRLDIFALGVTAYQLCAYELPWPSQDVSGKAAVAHDNKPPVDIFKVCPNLNRTLGEAIVQCIQRHPADRPPSAQVIARMIRNVTSEIA
jgi:serine/threonine-protein kinase